MRAAQRRYRIRSLLLVQAKFQNRANEMFPASRPE
jgi:hypothetical protein